MKKIIIIILLTIASCSVFAGAADVVLDDHGLCAGFNSTYNREPGVDRVAPELGNRPIE